MILLSYYMKKLIRTTITIPEDIYKQAKIKASLLRESFSAYVVESLQERLSLVRTREKTKRVDPKKTLGVFSIGVKKILKRSEIYAQYLKRKLGS